MLVTTVKGSLEQAERFIEILCDELQADVLMKSTGNQDGDVRWDLDDDRTVVIWEPDGDGSGVSKVFTYMS